MDINRVFPQRLFYQGDTWSFSVLLSDYDSSLYTLKYILKKVGVAALTIASTPATDGTFLMVCPSATTATLQPGLYYVSALILDGSGNKTTLGQVEIQVRADLSAMADSIDPRSPNKIALDAIEAALAAGAGSDLESYTIGGETFKKNRAGLLELRAFYLNRVRQEEGKKAIGNIYYNF